MEPALSRQLKSAGEVKFRRSRRERARIELASAGDVELSISAVPFADVGFALGFDAVTPRERDEFVCRAVNVVVAAVALVILAPLVVLIAVAIKLTTPGPVLYSQIRVGVDRRWRFARSFDRRTHDFGGRLFRMYKFRTMYQNADRKSVV